MSDNINYDEIKKTHSFASHIEPAWHNLGQIVAHAMTWDEAVELANLGYEVGLTSIHAQIGEEPNLIYSPYEERFATYRKDNNAVLGLVGSRYEVVQNKDAFGFFDAIIDRGEAIFETAGALGKGEKIFVTAKLPNDILVKGEPCNQYIMLTTSHDGSSSIIAGFTTVRVVCSNTLEAALRGLSNKVAIQHTTGAKEKLAEAYKVMGLQSKYSIEISEVFNNMANTKMDDSNLKKYITDVMKPEYKKKGQLDSQNEEEEVKNSTRLKNQVDAIYNFCLSHPTQQTDTTRGTVYGAYNGISGAFNYLCKFKNQEQKFTSTMFGNANKKISKAFDLALSLM